MRLLDCTTPSAESKQLSVGQLIKTWRPTDPQPHVVREVRIHGTAEALSVEFFGAGASIVPSSFPVIRANSIFAANPSSREGMSFFAECVCGYMVSRFQGNVNLGLLVLAGFHDFKDGSAHSNYFSREFFYCAEGPQAQPSGLEAPITATGSRQLDVGSLLGRWRNTNSSSLGIATIEICEREQSLGIRAYGVGESGAVDWGETLGSAYAKDCFSSDAMAFSSGFDSREIYCHLQANVKQGVLVVAYFTEFKDGSGRSNYFSREFYYKENSNCGA